METIGQRIKRLRTAKGLSQRGLSELCGWQGSSRIGNYEQDTREPNSSDSKLIAKALDVTASYLIFGDELFNVTTPTAFESGTKQKSFPLISWIAAGNWTEAIEAYSLNEIEEWPSTTANVSENSFWLKVKGNSMTSNGGLSIPEGMLILVDPSKEAISGNLVVAKLEDSHEATFKKYVTDGGRYFLEPLNNQWPIMEINGNCKILGVVVEAKWPRLA